MIIGTFRSVNDDGFVGHLVTLSFGILPLIFIPASKGPGYDVVLPGPDSDGEIIKVGTANPRKSPKGGHLDVTMDCPGFQQPIKAKMKLSASREGTYALEWTRERRF